MCHDIIKPSFNENIKELTIVCYFPYYTRLVFHTEMGNWNGKLIFFFSLRIFHTPHFLHSALRTPHSAYSTEPKLQYSWLSMSCRFENKHSDFYTSVKSGWQIVAYLYMFSRMEQNKVVTITFERTFTLNKIKTSAWVDFGHVLGNAIQGTDRISFLPDQNNHVF